MSTSSIEPTQEESSVVQAEDYLIFLEAQGKPPIQPVEKRNAVVKIYAQYLKSRNNMTSDPYCIDSAETRKQLFDYVLLFRKLIAEEIGKPAMINLFGTDEAILGLYTHAPANSII